jgi:hypothetical protein
MAFERAGRQTGVVVKHPFPLLVVSMAGELAEGHDDRKTWSLYFPG